MLGIAGLRRVRADRVRRRLLRDEDVREDIVDEVHHHWVVYTLPTLELAAAVALLWLMLVSSPKIGWLLILLAAALLGHAAWKALVRFMDVFVVTNMRVFRVTGVLSSKHATTPLARILDITVDQPFLGLVLGYGHFTFESAAQEQGLRDIRHVGRPLARDLTIQRHVQQSGLRGPRPLHY
jgi:hypothetical protein